MPAQARRLRPEQAIHGRLPRVVRFFYVVALSTDHGAPMTAHPEQPDHLRRSLSNRHLQLIAIGGAIGTGLFMGSGKTISLAGPSILLVYLIIGIMLFFVMRAMGELLLSNLEYKSFIDFSTDLLGPWAGFFCGWTYWFCWIVTAIADVIAIASYAQFWLPGLAP
jgi:D-serine/D-alanine/glycine transporter